YLLEAISVAPGRQRGKKERKKKKKNRSWAFTHAQSEKENEKWFSDASQASRSNWGREENELEKDKKPFQEIEFQIKGKMKGSVCCPLYITIVIIIIISINQRKKIEAAGFGGD